MNTQELFYSYSDQIYFFILKRVKEKDSTNEIFQNSFLKIHSSVHQLKDEHKAKAWMYQIVRNEIINFYNQKATQAKVISAASEIVQDTVISFCCFDRFLTNLPILYKSAIELVYVDGLKQQQAAEILGISLANLKARIRRGKSILKDNFSNCCKFEIDQKGMLVGESNCSFCNT